MACYWALGLSIVCCAWSDLPLTVRRMLCVVRSTRTLTTAFRLSPWDGDTYIFRTMEYLLRLSNSTAPGPFIIFRPYQTQDPNFMTTRKRPRSHRSVITCLPARPGHLLDAASPKASLTASKRCLEEWPPSPLTMQVAQRYRQSCCRSTSPYLPCSRGGVGEYEQITTRF